jgi:hypothetical protein
VAAAARAFLAEVRVLADREASAVLGVSAQGVGDRPVDSAEVKGSVQGAAVRGLPALEDLVVHKALEAPEVRVDLAPA